MNGAFLLFCALLWAGCTDDKEDPEEPNDPPGTWVEMSEFNGTARAGAVAFSVGNKAYVGTGYFNSVNYSQPMERFDDFWEFDHSTDLWSQRAALPGAARSHATAFVIGSAAYVGLGITEDSDDTVFLNDFYRYDPQANEWTAVAVFPGAPRFGAFGFGSNEKGFVGTGNNGEEDLQEFWEYDPGEDRWSRKEDFPGEPRNGSVSFLIDGKAYVVGGVNSNGYPSDLFSYDPNRDSWSEKKDAHLSFIVYGVSPGRSYPAFFTIGSKAYVVGGKRNTTFLNDTWRYDPSKDNWEPMAPLTSLAVIEAVGLSVGGRGFVLTGRSLSGNVTDHMLEFIPEE